MKEIFVQNKTGKSEFVGMIMYYVLVMSAALTASITSQGMILTHF